MSNVSKQFSSSPNNTVISFSRNMVFSISYFLFFKTSLFFKFHKFYSKHYKIYSQRELNPRFHFTNKAEHHFYKNERLTVDLYEHNAFAWFRTMDLQVTTKITAYCSTTELQKHSWWGIRTPEAYTQGLKSCSFNHSENQLRYHFEVSIFGLLGYEPNALPLRQSDMLVGI